MGRHCAVIGCHNGFHRLDKWRREDCHIHGTKKRARECVCPQPFHLFSFPDRKKATERMKWVKLVNRKTPEGKNWQPKQQDRVCSYHFPDGEPTTLNPFPLLNLGYKLRDEEKPSSRLPPKKREGPRKTVPIIVGSHKSSTYKPQDDHSYDVCSYKCQCTHNCTCHGCLIKQKELQLLRHETDILAMENSILKTKVGILQKETKATNFISRILQTDRDFQIFTGVMSKEAFHKLHSLLQHKALKMRYWYGKQRVVSTKVKKKTKPSGRKRRGSPRKRGAKRKLSTYEELALVLMRLRLGLSVSFLAALFSITKSTCSCIFNTWIRFLAREWSSLVFWPDPGKIRAGMPKVFKSACPKLRCIIDCTEFYIEKPRDIQLQALTWSDYKKNNTVKVLVGIAPNGMLTFISKAYGGRTSDRHITIQSGILDHLDPGDTVLADRGFPIQNELMIRQCTLQIPPPAQGYNQMTAAKVKQTKRVANLRIHVERAIGRLKCFQFLKKTIPITLVPFIDDTIAVCAALVNLSPPLVY